MITVWFGCFLCHWYSHLSSLNISDCHEFHTTQLLEKHINSFWGTTYGLRYSPFNHPVEPLIEVMIQKQPIGNLLGLWANNTHANSGWWFQPLWKIWVRQLGLFFPIHGQIKNVPNHQPRLLRLQPACLGVNEGFSHEKNLPVDDNLTDRHSEIFKPIQSHQV